MKNSNSLTRNFGAYGMKAIHGAFLPLVLLTAGSVLAQSSAPAEISNPSWSTKSGAANDSSYVGDSQPVMITDPKPSAAIMPPATAGSPNPAYGWPTASNGAALPGDPNGEGAGYAAAPPMQTPQLQPRSSMPNDYSMLGDNDIVTEVPSRENELPEGTLIHVRLMQGIRSDRQFSGTNFSATLTDNLTKNGRIVVPAGSTLAGRVMYANSASLVHGGASIYLRPDEIITPDGHHLMLHAMVVQTDPFTNTKLKGDEGRIADSPDKGKAIGIVALSTGVGAGAGAIFGGPVGAITGASIGAGVSTVHWLGYTRRASLPANSQIVFSLSEPMTLEDAGPRSTAGLETQTPPMIQRPAPQPAQPAFHQQVATTPY
jgi:hypothetical protein